MSNEMREQSSEVREIFWTSGWDSTFRLTQLTRTFAGKVQPVYIYSGDRRSRKIEIEQMDKIYHQLISHPGTVSEILPLKIIDAKELPENDAITAAYKKLSEAVSVGTQYIYLAKYAIDHPYVEVGVKRSEGEHTGIGDTIKKFGALKSDGKGSWILDAEKSTPECNLVLGNFSYPIVKITEHEMVDMIKEWGCDDIMSNIWFCHSPINGKPCGICSPCEQKIEGRMEFLLPEKSVRRYKICRIFIKTFGNRGRNLCHKIILHLCKKSK